MSTWSHKHNRHNNQGCKIRFHVVLTHLIVCILQRRSQGSTTEVRGSHPIRLPIMRLFSFQKVNRESYRNPQLNAASSLQCKISEMASKLTTYYRERKKISLSKNIWYKTWQISTKMCFIFPGKLLKYCRSTKNQAKVRRDEICPTYTRQSENNQNSPVYSI